MSYSRSCPCLDLIHKSRLRRREVAQNLHRAIWLANQSHKIGRNEKFHFVLVKLINSLKPPTSWEAVRAALWEGDFSFPRPSMGGKSRHQVLVFSQSGPSVLSWVDSQRSRQFSQRSRLRVQDPAPDPRCPIKGKRGQASIQVHWSVDGNTFRWRFWGNLPVKMSLNNTNIIRMKLGFTWHFFCGRIALFCLKKHPLGKK